MQVALQTTSWAAIERAAKAYDEVMAQAGQRLIGSIEEARLHCDDGESIDELELHFSKVWVRWTANDFGGVTITGVDINGETVGPEYFSDRVIGGWERELEGRIADARMEASNER